MGVIVHIGLKTTLNIKHLQKAYTKMYTKRPNVKQFNIFGRVFV